MRDPPLPKKARVAVWFDRPSDTLCFADRKDPRMSEAEAAEVGKGGSVPEQYVVRIPLADADEFVEVVVNHCVSSMVAGEDFSKVLWGVQELLDGRAAHAISLSERLRGEMAERSGGTASRSSREATVRAEAWQRLRALRDFVRRHMFREDVGEKARALDAIREHYEEHSLDEP